MEEAEQYEAPCLLCRSLAAVEDCQTGAIVAAGIAELDRELGEGVLEWIQVKYPGGAGQLRSKRLFLAHAWDNKVCHRLRAGEQPDVSGSAV